MSFVSNPKVFRDKKVLDVPKSGHKGEAVVFRRCPFSRIPIAGNTGPIAFHPRKFASRRRASLAIPASPTTPLRTIKP